MTANSIFTPKKEQKMIRELKKVEELASGINEVHKKTRGFVK